MENTSEVEHYTLQLDEISGKQLNIYLYKNVENIEDIHKKLLNKELPCCIIKANLVLDPFQIAVAANKAVLNLKYKQMITKSLFTEVIYCLSTSRNISQSLATFGITSDTKNILVVTICDVQEKESVQKLIFSSIKGDRIPISKLSEFSDLDLIEKHYKIDEDELKMSSVLDSIVSRVSDKTTK